VKQHIAVVPLRGIFDGVHDGSGIPGVHLLYYCAHFSLVSGVLQRHLVVRVKVRCAQRSVFNKQVLDYVDYREIATV
jgi:hypothetical protein